MSYQVKHSILAKLDQWLDSLEKSKLFLKKHTGTFVSKKIRHQIKNIAIEWFDERLHLVSLGISKDRLDEYDVEFECLARLSLSISRKKSYNDVLDKIIPMLRNELMITIIKLPVSTKHMGELDNILKDTEINKIRYLADAIECAQSKQYRAATINGWNAAISEIHKTIERLEFKHFNQKCAEIIKDSGRYKRVTTKYTVNNLASLQKIPERDLLWIIEYLELIDNNQHERLEFCLTMRNNSSHPGNAEITPENLLSFFSDLREIIFSNSVFRLP